MRETWRQIALTSGARIYGLACSIAMVVLTTRMLGPSGQGVIAATLAWVMLFATASHLSLGQVAIHRATELRDTAEIARIFGVLLLFTASVTLCCWILALALWWLTHGEFFQQIAPLTLLVGFAGLPFFIWEQYGSALLTILQRLDLYNKAQLVGRTCGLLVLGAVFWLGWQNTGAIIALVLSQMVVALGGISLLWGQLARSQRSAIRPTWSTLRTLLGGGLKLHLNAIGAVLFTSTDVLIVNQYHGAAATGHYQFAVSIISALMVVPQAATLVLYGQMAQSGPIDSWGVQRRVLAVLVGLMALGGSLAAALAPWVLPLIAGDAFLPSIPVFQILVIVLIGSTFSIVMAPQWIGQGLFWQASLLTLAVGVLNVAANLLAVPAYGMIGAAWATVAAYSIAIVTNGWMVFRCETRYRRQAMLHPNRITP